jgi:single-strand DNA-binding protein
MSIVNNVTIIGRLTSEPRIFSSKGWDKVFATIAVQRTGKDKYGKKNVDFITVQSMNRTGTFSSLATRHKGELVLINSELHSENYIDHNGEPIYKTVIWVNEIKYLESNASHITRGGGE